MTKCIVFVLGLLCAIPAAADVEGQSFTPQMMSFYAPEFPLSVPKTEGQVTVEFGLNRKNAPVAPRIVASTLPDAYGAAVLDVSQYWAFKFEPFDDDCNRLLEGQRRYVLVVYFEHDADKWKISISKPGEDGIRPERLLGAKPLTRVYPIFPRDAIRAGIKDGCVIAELRVLASGAVEGVKVVSSEPPAFFDASTTEAFQKWTFRPDDRGEAIRVTQVLIFYVLTEQ